MGLLTWGGRVQKFLQLWGVKHSTSIPHVSTGQVIVERAHWTIKEYLAKQKGTEQTDPVIRLQQVLFTLNFLSLAGDAEQLPVVTHNSHIRLQATPGVQICCKDPRMGQWGGPSSIVI